MTRALNRGWPLLGSGLGAASTSTLGYVPPSSIPPSVLATAKLLVAASQVGSGGPITGVLPTPATITVGAAAGNSVLDPSVTFGSGGKYLSIDTTRFRQVAGKFENTSGKSVFARGRISNISAGARGSTFGNGFAMRYTGRRFEFSQSGSGLCAIYVTNPATGQRLRATANDFTTGTNVFVQVDFGSYADRIIEVYAQGTQVWSGFVPEAGYDFALPPSPAVRWGLVWDSWGAGVITPASGQTANTTNTKIGTGTYMGAALGDPNIYCSCTGGTGHLFGSPSWPPTSTATTGGYIDRISPTVAAMGDLDVGVVGVLDALYLHPSVNDNANGTGNKPSDAQEQEAVRVATLAAMSKQPSAIIFGGGPQGTWNGTAGSNPPTSRYDACKAGFMAAAAGDPRMVWVDMQDVYADPARNLANIGSDNLHPTDAGSKIYGELEAARLIASLKAKMGL